MSAPKMTRYFVTFCTALLVTAAHAQTNQSNRIALVAILSLTGAAAPCGEDNLRGLEFAADLINERGSIRGRKIILNIQDSAGAVAQTVTLAIA